MKKIISAALAALLLCIAVAPPASAMDRYEWWYGQNPPSAGWNSMARFVRLGFGQLVFDLLGRNTGGLYSNLSIQTSSGLFVVVGPTATNTVGSVYQYLADDLSPYGGPGATALGVDNDQIFQQGLMYANGPTIGPLTPPGTAGQSIDYLVEAKINTVDQNPQTVTYVSASGIVTQGSANTVRADAVTYQAKAGTAAATGTQTVPSADSGWIPIGYVAVAYGTATITTGMITPLTTNLWGGALSLNGANYVTLPPATGTPPASSVAMYNDGAATNGWAFNIPSGSTNGYQFNIGGVAGVNFTAAGGNVNVPGSVVAGSTIVNGPSTLSFVGGDLVGGRSSNTGALHLGGNLSHVDCDWNVTVTGYFACSQPLNGPSFNATSFITVQQGGVRGYVPPVYATNGTATATTWHRVQGSCTTNASGQCAITLTSPAAFASTAYEVTCNSASSTATFCNYLITDASHFTLYVFSQSGAAVGAGNGVSFNAEGA